MQNNNNGNQFNGQKQFNNQQTKFCKFCGASIPMDAVICTKCGRQVEQINGEYSQQPNIVINNTASANANNIGMGRAKDKWIALICCCVGLIGIAGIHKFYEGKVGMGIIYLFTLGLFGIGTVIDIIAILMKPNPYYV